MPTESEYRIAASGIAMQIDGLSGLDAQQRAIESNPGVEGGTAGPTIVEAMAVNVADLTILGQQLAALEDELRRRADQCAQYTADWYAWQERHRSWRLNLERYHRSANTEDSLPHPGAEPSEPLPPFPEAVVG